MPDTHDDPSARLAEALDRVASRIEDALVAVAKNQTELVTTRSDLHRWQRTVVVLAVLVVVGPLWNLGILSWSRQVDCDRTNEARRMLSEEPGIDFPQRDCAWPT